MAIDVSPVDGEARKHRDSAASVREMLAGGKLPRRADSEPLGKASEGIQSSWYSSGTNVGRGVEQAEAGRIAGTPAIRHSIAIALR
jgi:hypothetical protein